jgi:CBS domain-containing protein
MPVKDYMTKHPPTVEPEMPILEAQHLTTESNIRHLPVVSEGIIVGLITENDLLSACGERI